VKRFVRKGIPSELRAQVPLCVSFDIFSVVLQESANKDTFSLTLNVCFQKKSIPTPWKVIGNS